MIGRGDGGLGEVRRHNKRESDKRKGEEGRIINARAKRGGEKVKGLARVGVGGMARLENRTGRTEVGLRFCAFDSSHSSIAI